MYVCRSTVSWTHPVHACLLPPCFVTTPFACLLACLPAPCLTLPALSAAGIDSPSTQEQLPALRSSHFGEVLLEVDAAGSWVHSVAWSRSGTTMACCSHDACVRIIQGLHFQQQAQPEQQQVGSSGTPCDQRVCVRTLLHLAFIGSTSWPAFTTSARNLYTATMCCSTLDCTRCLHTPQRPCSAASPCSTPPATCQDCTTAATTAHHSPDRSAPRHAQAPSILQLPGLPAKVILALGDRAFITGGWDGHMYLLQHQPGGGWSSQVLPTEGLEEEASPLETPQASSLIAAKLEQLRLQAGGSGGSPKRHHASGAGGGMLWACWLDGGTARAMGTLLHVLCCG